ncbi:MAG: cupin domain-containing protein [Lachnospiraceae bacterium]|nr:cupin domain-containing protein [Lachnospiraceae bacterium]
MNPYIKNFPVEEVVKLADQITARPGEIVSKTLAQNDAVSMTLFAFDKGEEISAHESTGDAFVTVLEGVGEYTVGDKKYEVKAGESLIMPANVPHAVYGKEAFKWLLVVVFPCC